MIVRREFNFSSVEDSNAFLRCLWATIRAEHPQTGWQTTPFRLPNTNTIFLGYISIGDIGAFEVSIDYEKKGVVKWITFSGGESNSQLILNSLIDIASSNYNSTEASYKYTFFFRSMWHTLGNIRGKNFEIMTYPEGNLLSISLRGYDRIDAHEKYREYVQPVLDVLSALTNLPWWLDQVNGEEVEATEVFYDLDQEDQQPWVDGFPIVDGFVRIGESGKNLIDEILESSEKDTPLLAIVNSCHHFHLARKMECIAFDSVIIRPIAEIEGAIIGDIDESNPFLAMRPILPESSELAVSLYCSALEVLAQIKQQPTERCSECGQLKFSIKKRVLELVTSILNEHVAKHFISPMYDRRSKYLHTGSRTIERYAGVSNPQLDPSTTNGVKESHNVNSLNLREYTSYSIRNFVQDNYPPRIGVAF